MSAIHKQIVVNAPIEDVWASWDAFGDIMVFNPNVNKSKLLPGSQKTGLGAKRRCDFTDGKNHVLEEIVGYQPQESMTVAIYEGSVPIKSATVRLDFEPISASQTRITVHMDFTPKFGFVGGLLKPMMRKQFGAAFEALLAGNAQHVEKQFRDLTAA